MLVVSKCHIKRAYKNERESSLLQDYKTKSKMSAILSDVQTKSGKTHT